MVFFKIAGGVVAGTTALALVSDTFRFKLDRNIFRPVRNYRAALADDIQFQTQEDFYQFLSEFGKGLVNMVRVEDA